MLIGINGNGEIIQINDITDTTLTQIEIDRDKIFPGFSDMRILNYKYMVSDGSISIVPLVDLKIIDKLEIQQGIIQTLGQQVTNLMLGV